MTYQIKRELHLDNTSNALNGGKTAQKLGYVVKLLHARVGGYQRVVVTADFYRNCLANFIHLHLPSRFSIAFSTLNYLIESSSIILKLS